MWSKVVLTTLGLCLILYGRAEAQSSSSVVEVMKAAGCNLGWYVQVLIDSGDGPTQLRGGNETCKEDPPAQVAKISEMLLRMDTSSRQMHDLLTEVATLKRLMGEKETQVGALQGENDELKSKVFTLETSRPEPRPIRVIPSNSATRNDPRVLLVTGFSGLGAGLLIMHLTLIRLAKGKVQFAKKRSIRDFGETHEFILVGVRETSPGSGVLVGKYKCTKCSERNLFGPDENFRSHLRREHSDKRVSTQIDPTLLR